MYKATYLFILATLLTSSHQAFAQQWVEPGARWSIAHDPGFGECLPCQIGFESWSYTSDTLIDNKICQVLTGELDFVSYHSPSGQYTYDQYQELDDQHIFYSSGDTSWYFFEGEFIINAILNAQVGQRWSIPASYATEDIDVVLDSTYENNVLGNGLRGLWCHLESFWNGDTLRTEEPLEIVEGRFVGHEIRPRYCPPFMACDDGVLRRFLCFSSDITNLVQVEEDCMPLLSSLTEYDFTQRRSLVPMVNQLPLLVSRKVSAS